MGVSSVPYANKMKEFQPKFTTLYLGTMVGIEEDVEGLQVSMPCQVVVEVRHALRHIFDDVPRQLQRSVQQKGRRK